MIPAGWDSVNAGRAGRGRRPCGGRRCRRGESRTRRSRLSVLRPQVARRHLLDAGQFLSDRRVRCHVPLSFALTPRSHSAVFSPTGQGLPGENSGLFSAAGRRRHRPRAMIAMTSQRRSSGANVGRWGEVWHDTQALPSGKRTRGSTTYVFLRKGPDLCVECWIWSLPGCPPNTQMRPTVSPRPRQKMGNGGGPTGPHPCHFGSPNM